jgi:hypothetical protein
MLDIDSVLAFKSASEEKMAQYINLRHMGLSNSGADPLESRPNR